jgi:hypothetical protein
MEEPEGCIEGIALGVVSREGESLGLVDGIGDPVGEGEWLGLLDGEADPEGVVEGVGLGTLDGNSDPEGAIIELMEGD